MNIGFVFTGLQDLVRGSGIAAANFESIARSAADISRATVADKPVSGPAARLIEARANLDMLKTAGAPAESLIDAQVAEARAQRAFASARRLIEGPSTTQQLGDVISSSRFGRGGLMPLLGKSANLLGGPVAQAAGLGAEAAGPVGLALLGAVKGVEEFTRMLGQATQGIRELTTAASTSGGGIGQAAFLSRMGLSSGMGTALRERMATDPFAMQAGQRLGIGSQLPLPFGSQNTAQLQIQVIQNLRGIESAEERLRIARMLGQEQLVELAATSNLVFRQLRADANATRMILGGEATQLAARDLAAGTGRVTSNFELLFETLSKPVIPIAADAVNALATGIGVLSVVTNFVLTPITKITEQFHRLVGMFGGGGGAMDEHTKAMQEHTAALREGTYGGGARARGAVPEDLRGDMLSRAIERDMTRMGAF